MKDTILDANFPRTTEGRVYHLGLKHGDLANRIVTVGDPSRARKLAEHLTAPDGGEIITVESERGFLTITGVYKGVPMSIVAIGMGFANMDFFVREGRECVHGDLYIIRFGSCGCLTDLDVGSIVVPKASVAVTRNYDYDYSADGPPASDEPYRISKPAPADDHLHSILVHTMSDARPASIKGKVVGDCLNASADSFYSSQGRVTSFPDNNEGLITRLLDASTTTLEASIMETFHLLHLAAVYRPKPIASQSLSMPPTRLPADIHVKETHNKPTVNDLENSPGQIHAAAAQMVFASRSTNAFITPDEVVKTQGWAGVACLDALAKV